MRHDGAFTVELRQAVVTYKVDFSWYEQCRDIRSVCTIKDYINYTGLEPEMFEDPF